MSDPPGHDVLAALARVVQAGPDRIAVEDHDGALTYAELWRWAGAVGTWLKGQGVGRGALVGLATPRSAAHVAALLGAWWAGAAFLPLPPELPRERRRWIVDEAAPAALLDPAELDRLRRAAGEPLPPARPDRDDLAYVIYTSGSSGRPKGVRIAHRGVLSLLRAQVAAFGLHPRSRALFVLSPAFDAAISDVGTVLLAGGALVIPEADLLRDPAALRDALARARITAIDLPPALLRHLVDERPPPSLEVVILGGEPSPPALVRRLAAAVRVVNVYGPTEATVCVSLCACDPETWDRPRLGDPLPGVRLTVLGADGEDLSPGTEGELAIAGPCLALGYLNRPEEEAARFLVRGGERLYRSGDRVRVLADGGLEFLGRVDRQRKVGGVRLELDEIEVHLAGHPGVAAAAIEVDAAGRLIALVEPRDPARPPAPADLRGHLRDRLPAAALPRRIELVAALPRGVSGKLDRPALARLLAHGDDDDGDDDGEHAPAPPVQARLLPRPPGGPTEHATDAHPGDRTGDDPAPIDDADDGDDPARALLAALWRRALGVPRVRAHDRFCALGGGSLAALDLVAAADACGLAVSAARLLADASFAEIAAELAAPAGELAPASALQADVDAALRALLQACPNEHDSSDMSQETVDDAPMIQRSGTCPEGHPPFNRLDADAGAREAPLAASSPPPRPGADPRLPVAGPPAAPSAGIPARAPAPRADTLLLTGATGSLGAPLLRELARAHRGRLLCLVRARDPAAARARLRPLVPADARAEVVPVVGDLAAPRLGLDPAAWRRLAADVDGIVHAGALVHLALGYPELRPTNLGGTRAILELAAAARVRALHYVSTLGVFVGALPVVPAPHEDDPLDGTEAVIGGYAQSKWAAERLVRAFAPGRFPAVIHRLGLVVGDPAPRDQLTLFLRGLAELGVVPEGHAGLRLDLTPVDVAARGLARLALEDLAEETDPRGACRTLHLAAARGATAADLVAALRRRGRPIREVDHRSWRALARDLGARSPAAALAYLALCRALGDAPARRLRPYDLFLATGFDLRGPRGAAALARHGLAVPDVTPRALDRLVALALAPAPGHDLDLAAPAPEVPR